MRIPAIDPMTAPPDVRTALERLPDLGLFRVAAHAETAFGPWLAFSGALLSALELDPRLRELAILQVARQERCDYEWAQHEAIAAGVGVAEAQLEALRGDDLAAPVFAEVERLVLGVVAEIGADGGARPQTIEALGRLMSVRAMVELVIVAGHYAAIARLVASFAIPVDEPADLALVDAAEGQR